MALAAALKFLDTFLTSYKYVALARRKVATMNISNSLSATSSPRQTASPKLAVTAVLDNSDLASEAIGSAKLLGFESALAQSDEVAGSALVFGRGISHASQTAKGYAMEPTFESLIE